MTLLEDIRADAQHAPESGIVAVANYGREKPGLIPLWVGEGDLPTPTFITDATNRALNAGETFYTWQRGIPRFAPGIGALSRATFRQAVCRGRVPRYRRGYAGDLTGAAGYDRGRR